MDEVEQGEHGRFPEAGLTWGWGGRDKCPAGPQASAAEGCCQRRSERFWNSVQETRVDSRAEPQHEVAGKGLTDTEYLEQGSSQYPWLLASQRPRSPGDPTGMGATPRGDRGSTSSHR